MSLALRKWGLMHVRKVPSQISLYSPHRLIRDDTFHYNGIFRFLQKSTSKGKCLVCIDWKSNDQIFEYSYYNEFVVLKFDAHRYLLFYEKSKYSSILKNLINKKVLIDWRIRRINFKKFIFRKFYTVHKVESDSKTMPQIIKYSTNN